MSEIRRICARSLLLTGALAFAFGAPALAQNTKPRAKPSQIESPAPAGQALHPHEKKPPPPQEEPAPPEEPAEPEKEPQPEEPLPPEEPVPPAEEEEPPGKPAPEDEDEAVPAEPGPSPETAPRALPAEEKEAPAAEEEVESDKLDKDAVQAVVDMSSRLAKLESFTVEADLAWEEVLENGEKIVSLEQVQADVVRPHRLRMERKSPGRERILFYNGERVVLWGPVTRYYAAVPFEGRLAELAVHLADTYGYEIPLADLFTWGHEKKQIEAIEVANFVGQDLIGGRLCDHYAYRQEGADWQVWIDTAEGGLPCRYAIVDKSDPARPLFQATVEIEPEAGFFDKRFTFAAPEDAAEIPLATTQPVKEDEEDAEEKAQEQEPAPENGSVPQAEEKPEQKEAPKAAPAPKDEPEAEGEEAPAPDAGEDNIRKDEE